MSRRYGRRWRRKARAKMAELEQALSNASRNNSIAESIVQIAMDISPNSICFEPEYCNYHPKHPLHFEFCPDVISGTSIPPKIAKLEYVDMFKLESSLTGSHFNKMIHFRVGFTHPYEDDIVAGYAITKEGLRAIPLEVIASELAVHIKSGIALEKHEGVEHECNRTDR